ncbi:GNAT family N-acetyltransferase [Aliikangiella sp. IMCC44653]
MSNSIQLPVILTHSKRLILRQMLEPDCARVQAYRANPKVARYQGWTPQTVDEVVQHAQAMQKRQTLTQGFCYQIVLEQREAPGQLVGDMAFTLDTDTGKTVELGIAIDCDFQKQGFALEAMRALISYLFNELNMHRIHVCIDPNNQPSIQLCQRAGLRLEGHLKQSSWFKGEWVDDLLMGILQSEWKADIL